MKRSHILLLAFMALCIALNIVGSNIALMLKLPIYLDSIGTLLTAACFGPIPAMTVGALTGIIVGATSDLYSLFFMPVQLIIGLVAGIVFQRLNPGKIRHIWWTAFIIGFPGTIVSTIITVICFGGITSSGSSMIVQVLLGTGLSKPIAVFIVQMITDYADRLVSLLVVGLVYKQIANRLVTN